MKFRNICLEDKPLVEKYTKQWKLINSSYTFTNLYIWGHSENIQIAEESDVLYVMFRFGGRINMLAPIMLAPEGDYARAVSIGTDYLKSLNLPPKFCYASEGIYDMFATQCKNVSFSLDRDNCDYIYVADNLISLPGKHYHAKRNHINRFISQYPDYEYVKITPDMEAECIAVFDEWLDNKDVLLPGMEGEKEAILRLVRHMDCLGVTAGGIRVGGKLVAVSFGEFITPEIGLVHIEKANDLYDGIYPTITQSFSQAVFSDVKFINREEDMGIEGLRKSKLSFRPAMLVEKYTVTLEG